MARKKHFFFLLLCLYIIGTFTTCKARKSRGIQDRYQLTAFDIPWKPINTLMYASQNASQEQMDVTHGYVLNTGPSFKPDKKITIRDNDLALLTVLDEREKFCVFLLNTSRSICIPANPNYTPPLSRRSSSQPSHGQLMHFDPKTNVFTWFNATSNCIQLLKSGDDELVLTVFCSSELIPSQALIDYNDWLLFWLPKNGSAVLRTTLYSRQDAPVLERFDYPVNPGDRIKFAIDPTRRQIYWLSKQYLKSGGYSGSGVKVLKNIDLNKSVTHLVFDGSNRLYWTEISQTGSSAIHMHDLEAPSTPAHTTTVVLTLQNSIIHAIALQPESPPRSDSRPDPCSHGQCSHFCSPAAGQPEGYICWCPEELIILRDGRTCHKATLLVATQLENDPGKLHVFQADASAGSKGGAPILFPPMNISNSAYVITGNATTWRFCWVALDRSIQCKTNQFEQVTRISNSSVSRDLPLMFINPQGTELYWSERRPGCFKMYSFPLSESLEFPCLPFQDLNSTAISLDYRRRSFFWSVNEDKTIRQRNINIPGARQYSNFAVPEPCTGLAWDEDQFRLFALTKNQVYQAVKSGNFYHGLFISLIKLPYEHARHLQHHRNVLFWVGGIQSDGQFIDALRLNPTQPSGKPLDHIRIFTNPPNTNPILSFQAYELFNFVKTWNVPCDTANCSHFCFLDDEFPRANISAHKKFVCRCPDRLLLSGSTCMPRPLPPEKEDSYIPVYVSISVIISVIGIIVVIATLVIRYRKQRFIISLQLTISELLEGNEAAASAATETSEKVQHLPFTSVINKEALHLSTDKVLGEGNFGIVYQGVYDSQPVAIKTLKHGQDLQMLADFVRELKTLQYVGNHEHIVRFFGGEVTQVQEGRILVVLELSPYGSLQNYILSKRKMHTPRGDLQFTSTLPPHHGPSTTSTLPTANRYDLAPRHQQLTLDNQSVGNAPGNTYTEQPGPETPPFQHAKLSITHLSEPRSQNNSGDLELTTFRGVKVEGHDPSIPVPIPAPRQKISSPECLYSNWLGDIHSPDDPSGTPNPASEPVLGLPQVRFSDGIDPQILQAMELDCAQADDTDIVKTQFPLDLLMDWGKQIAQGMMYLGEKNIVHGDLAARNILVFEGGIVKISDFGFAQNVYQQQSTYAKKMKKALPWRWAAIETLTRAEMSSKSDVWSFGVTLWEIFTFAKIPFPQYEWSQEFIVQLRNGMRLDKPDNVSQEMFKNVFLSCWSLDPDKRPTFQNLVAQLSQLHSDLVMNSIK